MKHHWIVMIALLARVVPACAQTPLAARLQRIVDQEVDLRGRGGRPVGIVLGVQVDGVPTIVGAGAVARGAARRPDARTIFEIGSITKVFTGLALAIEVERGRVRLEDPIASYLPPAARLSRGAMRITLLDLATHTAGLPRDPPGGLYPGGGGYSDADVYRMLSAAPVRTPGQRAVYSNLGFGVLGHVLALRERISQAELFRRITDRLGLADTRLELTGQQQGRLATGYGPGTAVAPPIELGALSGAGGLRSTAHDLLRFLGFAITPPDQELARAFAGVEHARQPMHEGSVGLGLEIEETPEGPCLAKGGGTRGYRSYLLLDRQRRIGIVLLASSGSFVMRGLAHRVHSLLANGR